MTQALPSEHDQVRIDELARVVGSLPRHCAVLFWWDKWPHLGFPVEDAHIVEPCLIRGTSSEQNYFFCWLIEVQGVVGPSLRFVAWSGDLCPYIVDNIVGPDVIEIFAIFGATTIASEHGDFGWAHPYEAMTPPFLGDYFVLAAVSDSLPRSHALCSINI